MFKSSHCNFGWDGNTYMYLLNLIYNVEYMVMVLPI